MAEMELRPVDRELKMKESEASKTYELPHLRQAPKMPAKKRPLKPLKSPKISITKSDSSESLVLAS